MIPPASQPKPLFTIVVSEKGGAERREAFDRPEITVGRVQGNELMLPKGNVSKRHARLVHRDGRFIVTDLNSTNGTYVNRRRITQPTIVREGDRIYVGDFVIKVESADGSQDAPADSTGSGPLPAPGGDPAEPELSSSYPELPGPPRVPSGQNVPSTTLEPSSAPADEVHEPSVVTRMPPADPTPFVDVLQQLVGHVAQLIEPGALEQDNDATLGLRIEQLIEQQAAQLVDSNAGIPRDALVRDARAELLDLGPLAAWLNDSSITEVVVRRFDDVSLRRGGKWITAERPFSSEAALRRTLRRACRRSGVAAPDNGVVEGRLLGGARLWAAVGDPAPSGTVLTIKKAERNARSLDAAVKAGALSRAMATCAAQCLSVGGLVVVTGARDSDHLVLAASLPPAALAASVVAIDDIEELPAPGAIRLSAAVTGVDLARLVGGAARLGDVVIVDASRREVAASALGAIAEGAGAAVLCLPASTAPRALARLASDVAATLPGFALPSARELIAAGVDLVIEVSRLGDGRQRVTRMAQPVAREAGIGLEDIFTFVVERTSDGSVEGSFTGSGIVPRFVDGAAHRGAAIDASLFTRPPSR